MGEWAPTRDGAMTPTRGAAQSNPTVRNILLLVSAGLALFWVYSIYHIISATSAQGGGMELVAIVPMTAIFGVMTVPAFLTARAGKTGWAIGFAAASLIANVLLWRQILTELA